MAAIDAALRAAFTAHRIFVVLAARLRAFAVLFLHQSLRQCGGCDECGPCAERKTK